MDALAAARDTAWRRTGFEFIRYVRVQATEAIGYGGEVDAVADVRSRHNKRTVGDWA